MYMFDVLLFISLCLCIYVYLFINYSGTPLSHGTERFWCCFWSTPEHDNNTQYCILLTHRIIYYILSSVSLHCVLPYLCTLHWELMRVNISMTALFRVINITVCVDVSALECFSGRVQVLTNKQFLVNGWQFNFFSNEKATQSNIWVQRSNNVDCELSKKQNLSKSSQVIR